MVPIGEESCRRERPGDRSGTGPPPHAVTRCGRRQEGLSPDDPPTLVVVDSGTFEANAAAAFFDLDKTTIATASMLAFSSTLREHGFLDYRLVVRALWGRVVYQYLGADEDRMETMRNTALKLCKGWDRAHMARLVDEAMEEVIDPIVYREALDEMAAHRAAGHKVFMVSASPEEIVRPLARHLGADGSVASTAKVDSEGRFTGEMDFYSYGPYKVDAMEALALEHDLDLDHCYAYSDSITDLPMLEAVGHPVVVNPDRALARIAAEREWEVRWFSNKVSLRSRVGQHARTRAVIAGAGALAGGGGRLYRSHRSRTR